MQSWHDVGTNKALLAPSCDCPSRPHAISPELEFQVIVVLRLIGSVMCGVIWDEHSIVEVESFSGAVEHWVRHRGVPEEKRFGEFQCSSASTPQTPSKQRWGLTAAGVSAGGSHWAQQPRA